MTKRNVFSIIALILFLAFAVPMFAQQSNETVSVPKSMLTEQQKSDLAAKELQDKVSTYGKWVGIGHELGTAVNESLVAVTTQANNFAQTPVGKLTAGLVIWKVVGHDAMGFIMGSLEIIIILPLWVWSYRRFLPRQVLAGETFDPTSGKRMGRTYKTINDPKDEKADGWLIGHWVCLAILFLVSMMTMWM